MTTRRKEHDDMTPTNSIERLQSLHSAHLAARGACPDVALMASALATNDPAVCASVAAHVETTTPKETVALAQIARELDVDAAARPPSLWLEIDLAAPTMQIRDANDARVSLLRDGAMRARHVFRREPPALERLAARLLLPNGCDGRLLEAAGRILLERGPCTAPTGDARAALIVAAYERAHAKGK